MSLHSQSISAVRRGIRAAVASLATAALVLAGLVVIAAPAQAAGGTAGTVSGIVFQDFSSSGWYTTGSAAAGVPRNRPVDGVTVKAFDAEGDLVGTAVSGADGMYTLPVAGAFSTHLRVEFSGWSEIYEPAFAAQGTPPASTQGDNNTSVQFVTLPSPGGSVTGVDFGLIIPDQVIQPDAPIATVIQYAGDPNYTGPNSTADRPTLVAQPWSKVGSADNAGHFAQRTELADFGQVGSAWGVSYNRVTNSMILAASLKRMSGLGDLGLGGIYRVPDVLAADGSIRVGAGAENWFSVQGLAVNGGGTIDLGQAVLDSYPARGLGSPNTPARDRAGFALAARIGIGGVATTLDGETLFITNLHDGEVYGIDVSDPSDTSPPVWRVSTPVGANQQLWALTVRAGRLYMGYVDTGTDPGVSAGAADMNAYVVSVPVSAAADPAGAVVAGDWRTELVADLGYVKGSNMNGWPTASTRPQLSRWNSWADTWVWPGSPGGAVGFDTAWGWTHAYPQPVLSSLAFDIDGYLNLGFTDRTAIQSGNLNVGSDIELPGDRFYETVANGDILVAGPLRFGMPTGAGCPTAATGLFVLECNGKVGERDVRTTTVSGQTATYNNNQGPATGEFFNDSMNIGASGGIHNDNTLGAIATYPGVDEVMSTATDPLAGIYRSGLMWFDQRNGTATRGFDQVEGAKDIGSAAFQKGGGLGGVALLAVAAPVEIGNRVWLDADLNGRQDPDEPAINGAVVELWTDAGNGVRGELIATRTTSTINGQPGTYYFRTDDPDVAGTDGGPAFVDNSAYVLTFRPGTTLTLAGPNADHPGFVGLAWDDLQLTKAVVRVTPTTTNGGTTEVNDSNPNPLTGEFALSVGGPGQNNHTYDAGWYGVAPYEVLKTVSGPGPEGVLYDVEVTSAVNFRSQERLAQGGADPGGRDPKVTKTQYKLTPGVPQTSGQDLPYGYTLEFAEVFAAGAAPPDASIVFTPAVAGSSPPKGRLVVSPSTGGAVTLEVENLYGSLQVAKTLRGDPEAIAELEDFEFTVNWTSSEPAVVGAATSGSFTVTGDGSPAPATALAFPAGTTVTLSETTPTNLPPGVEWTGLQWTAASNVAVNSDGTATVTILGGQSSATTVALTNTVENLLGSFTVQKALSGDFALSDPEFANASIPIEYSYVDAETGQTVEGTLTLNTANGFMATGPTLPTGTVVTLIEGTPTGTPANVEWGDISWTVNGGSTQLQPVEVTIGDATTAALVVTNEVTEVFGTFEVTKDFDGDFDADDPLLADVVITVHWDGGGLSGDIELTQAGGWSATPTDAEGAAVVFPLGTVVTLTETGRTGGPPNLEWGEVSWSPNDPANPARGLVTVSSETTPAAITLTNGTLELFGTFGVTKAVTGDFDLTSPEMANAVFTVTATWEGGSQDLVLNQANAWTTGLGLNLPTGTVVTLSEAVPSGTGPSVEWGTDPTWSGTGILPNPDGTAEVTIGDGTSPQFTVTNEATELRGTFEVSKAVTGDMDLTDPRLADAVFTVGWTSSDGQSGSFELSAPDWAGGPSATFPLGATLTLSEPTISGTGPGVAWGEISWTPGDQGDGTAVVTISSDTDPLAITLTNEVSKLTGTLRVAKALTGDFDFTSPEMQSAEFTVLASWPAAPGLEAGEVEIVLTAGNGWSAAGGTQLPTGTVVTLSELEPSGTGPSVAWGDAVWSGDGITVNDDGTASFVIGNNTAPTFTVTNEVTELTGRFSVTKAVTGPLAGEVPEDFVFTVTYTYDGLPQPASFTVRAGETATSPEIPTGTEVTVSEVRPEGGVPAGAGWGNPVFVLSDGTSATGTATITIGVDDVVAVELENPTIPPLPPTGGLVPWLAGFLAIALLAVGGALMVLGIRRRRDATAS